ncbi:MAG: hypothetical protein KL863_05155 [Rhizobium sp.]|nr:hypothetical protein [Rhizobium sp.]
MTVTIKEKVADLAARHGIARSTDRAAFLSGAFSRIAGIDGDETLDLIADLLKARVISNDEASAFVLAHVREMKAV